MRSATSLLLGAALATAFFLLYTSLCRDLGAAAGNGAPSPPRWEQRAGRANETAATAESGGDQQDARLLNTKRQEEGVAKRKEVVTRTRDGDRGDDSATAGEKGRRDTGNKQQRPTVMPATSTPTKQQQKAPSQDLADLLRRAATADKTVLMTAINEAWAAPGSFLDLFLESFRHGEGTSDLPRHLLIVAMDGRAFERCLAVHPFCYWFRVDGMDFAGEQKYMKGDYLEMMWRRNRLQQSVLELGYSFLFTDVDILWFRAPFPRLPPGAQVVMSSDFFVGDTSSPGNYPNGGLLYVRSSAATVAFYEHWQASRARFPGKHEQYVFDRIVKEGVPAHIGARVQFLDTAVFGGFCQHGKDLGRVATMHANCCVGLDNKLFDLKNVLDDWKKYRALVAGGSGGAQGFSWRVPGRCIH
ncbi:Uncharacterized protein BAE44_0022371 [Dichanthelium oligosanthes]|uniref:Nucleotide-diphospho-sugar transferase domain-containing protein n=1 Tax=Dichanthelium oligosanthes TaxID=888268 RepID=A0A1E5UUR5_9POAL|nr:Uncharacterized protein BAE44_0022371 [Dichanthelium oligosanthes]